MKLLQKLLLVVVLLQLLVVTQLFLIKSNKGDGYSNFLKNPLTLVDKKESSLDNPLIDSFIKQIEKEKMNYPHLNFINRYLALVEKEELTSKGYIALNSRKKIHRAIRNKIEQNAKKFLGYRYVWGATGPNKFDCSGFTQKVFKIVGINLPRVSREQAKVGKYVSFDALKKGDIVFFDTKRRKTGRVTHVGIYLEDGKFIHASSGGKRVMITSFKKRAFYKNRFLWGRRII